MGSIMSLEKAKASLEAHLKKKDNTPSKEVKRPTERHSGGLGVKMSNALIEATHSLNLNERRIIYLAMTKLKGGFDVHLNAKEFADTFGINEKDAYKSLEKHATNCLTEK